MTLLELSGSGREDAEAFVRDNLAHLLSDPRHVQGSTRFVGGRTAALDALAHFRVAGYAAQRNEVAPRSRRGASGLSPYIRHGLLSLPELWEHVAGGPSRDVTKFRDELLWQEYARHLYARVGTAMRSPLRYQPIGDGTPDLDRTMACIDSVVTELETDGWMVNQTRMWMAGHWTTRLHGDWRAGEDWMFTHLLDGSRAANRLGWQWTVGAGTGKPYGFSRRQVLNRAPGMCDGCAHRDRCPIERWPTEQTLAAVDPVHPKLYADADHATTAGPISVTRRDNSNVDTVWLTAESIGRNDPALDANPDTPAVFVFDEALLTRLRLDAKRLVFLTECLMDVAQHHHGGLSMHLGAPDQILFGQRVSTTFAPVPGWKRLAARIQPVEVHPWRWLRRPGPGSAASFSAWNGRARFSR